MYLAFSCGRRGTALAVDEVSKAIIILRTLRAESLQHQPSFFRFFFWRNKRKRKSFAKRKRCFSLSLFEKSSAKTFLNRSLRDVQSARPHCLVELCVCVDCLSAQLTLKKAKPKTFLDRSLRDVQSTRWLWVSYVCAQIDCRLSRLWKSLTKTFLNRSLWDVHSARPHCLVELYVCVD